MKPTKAIALIMGVYAGSLLPAAADGPSFGHGNLPDHLVEQIDADGDGEITEEEVQAWRQSRRDQRTGNGPSTWDTDGDGTVSQEERDAARAELRRRVREMRAERHAEADTDDDGSLSLEEFSAIPAVSGLSEELILAIYNRLDADGEGGITADEFTSHLGGLRPMPPRPDRPGPDVPGPGDHPGGGGDGGDGGGDEAP